MSWVWVIVALLLGYGLGIAGLLAWREFRKPARRAFRRIPDRRRGQRRRSRGSGGSAGSQLGSLTPDWPWLGDARQAGPRGIERRGGDRRLGERRRGRPAWAGTTVLASAIVLALVATVSYAVTPVPSFFEGQPQLAGSGWADCETPITWSVDTSRLTPKEAAVAVRQLRSDFAKWGRVSGLDFRYVGFVGVSYDDPTYQIRSTTHPSDRHVFILFLHNDESSLLDERTVGLAMPSKLIVEERQIIEGSVVLSYEYVQRAARLQRSALYLHELGHALGLAHGASQQDAMFYIVSTTNELSPNDIAGIRALVQACNPPS